MPVNVSSPHFILDILVSVGLSKLCQRIIKGCAVAFLNDVELDDHTMLLVLFMRTRFPGLAILNTWPDDTPNPSLNVLAGDTSVLFSVKMLESEMMSVLTEQGRKKLKKRQGVGNCRGLRHQLKSHIQKRRSRKKRELFLKTTSEGRQKAKHMRFEKELERERLNKEEEQRRVENPELYLEQFRSNTKIFPRKLTSENDKRQMETI
ncbi:hypothetical protein Tco_0838298 [Tanacetum coccineum]|uniref:Uncharacterized protein n=1 Tax=Tanacetum coccineum TaxID=301880 RepID=A0ABQ5ANE8_9ASTR